MNSPFRKDDMTQKKILDKIRPENRLSMDLICAIAHDEFDKVPSQLCTLIYDVAGLYEGRWPTHEACEVEYHNFGHALDVALATARMIAGWNKSHRDDQIPQEIFLFGMAAAVFHDAGYIKDKGDRQGHGGKYTFTHVERGMTIAENYLNNNDDWPQGAGQSVAKMISLTDYGKYINIREFFDDDPEGVMAKMVATADLIAQMADVFYLPRLKDLYAEFKEVYDYESMEKRAKQGTHIYESAQEMMNGVMDFYEKFVVPLLTKFGRMDQYLSDFFGGDRNPYLENIAANLTSQLMDSSGRWQKLGTILEDLGLVNPDQVQEALKKQREREISMPRATVPVRTLILPWVNSNFSKNCLGDILMEMGAISPASLSKGLLSQMLPEAVIKGLSRNELIKLVKTSFILQNICKGPWVLEQVTEMAKDMLGCEASSILLINSNTEETLIPLSSRLNKKSAPEKPIPTDKGLSGWVYSNERPAMVSDVLIDDRFDKEIDYVSGSEMKSILAVPLHVNGECIGVIEVMNKINDNFSEHDMHILIVLGNMIANSLLSVLCLHEA